jgi:hypothetical protein
MSIKYPYVAAHQRVQTERGKAAEHACQTCGGQAYDWAYSNENPDPKELTDDSGRVYSNDPSFYIPMCRPCHRTYDFLHSKPTCPHGHPYEGGNLYISTKGHRVCRACHAEQARKRRQTPEAKAQERERSRRRHAARKEAK